MNKIDKWFLTRLKKDKKLTTWLPTKITYTNNLGKRWAGGVCIYKTFSAEIRIKPKYRGKDIGILNHELTHAKQYGNLFWLHLFLLNFDKYVFFIELDAYREQVKVYNYYDKEQYNWIIESLINPKKYGLKISREKAQKYADFMFEDLIQ